MINRFFLELVQLVIILMQKLLDINKKYKSSFILLCWLILCCGCANKSSNNNILPEELFNALKDASQSEVKEIKLFAGFEIGMSENQVDSVLRVLINEGKIADYHGDKSFETAVITETDSEFPLFISDFHYKFKMTDNNYCYLSFSPIYLNDKLCEMMYEISVANSSIDLIKDKPYIQLAHFFENTERGKTFHKIAFKEETGDSAYFFIKDNLLVYFDNLNGNGGEMVYRNVPDEEKMFKEMKAKEDPSSDF